MLADLSIAAAAWVENLVLLGLVLAIGALLFRRGLHRRLRRRGRAGRRPYQGDAADFERLLRS